MRRWVEVAGTEGSLVCDDFTSPWKEETARFWVNKPVEPRSQEVQEHRCSSSNQETCMIERFSEIVLTNQLDAFWTTLARETQLVCDALDQSARENRVIEIS